MNKKKESATVCQYIGQKMKEYREIAGLSMEDLGVILNVHRVSILNMESGRHKVSVDKLFILCGVFKCQVTDLFPPIEAINFVFEEKNILVKKKVKKIKIIK